MSNLKDHRCQREHMAAKRAHVPPDGTQYRACCASSRDSAPSIVWIRACRLRWCGCDRGTRAWPVLGEEARNQWRGWNVVLVIAHGLFSRGRRRQDCMYAGRTSHGRTVDRRAWSAMEGAEGRCWEGSGTRLCAWTGNYHGEHDTVSVAHVKAVLLCCVAAPHPEEEEVVQGGVSTCTESCLREGQWWRRPEKRA